MSQTQAPAKSFTIAKAWWPVWETFQIGLQQREKLKKSFRTTILQTDDYGPALDAFASEKVDAATLTIFEAILAADKGIPLKIVLLLDYTTGSDGIVASKRIRSLQDLKGKIIGVEIGTIAHFTVLKALEKAGLETNEVQLVDLGAEALQLMGGANGLQQMPSFGLSWKNFLTKHKKLFARNHTHQVLTGGLHSLKLAFSSVNIMNTCSMAPALSKPSGNAFIPRDHILVYQNSQILLSAFTL